MCQLCTNCSVLLSCSFFFRNADANNQRQSWLQEWRLSINSNTLTCKKWWVWVVEWNTKWNAVTRAWIKVLHLNMTHFASTICARPHKCGHMHNCTHPHNVCPVEKATVSKMCAHSWPVLTKFLLLTISKPYKALRSENLLNNQQRKEKTLTTRHWSDLCNVSSSTHWLYINLHRQRSIQNHSSSDHQVPLHTLFFMDILWTLHNSTATSRMLTTIIIHLLWQSPSHWAVESKGRNANNVNISLIINQCTVHGMI